MNGTKVMEYFNFILGVILSGHAAKSGNYLLAAGLFISGLISGALVLTYDKRYDKK